MVRHVKKRRSQVKSRRQMQDKDTFDTEGNGKVGEQANMGADLDIVSRAEWLANANATGQGKRKATHQIRGAFSCTLELALMTCKAQRIQVRSSFQ